MNRRSFARVTTLSFLALTLAAGSAPAQTPLTGDPPADRLVEDKRDRTLPLGQLPIALVKDGALDDGGDGVAHAGDLIHYTFEVTNTGTVTLTKVTVTDPLVPAIGCPTTTLAAGESMICSDTYELTQADVDAGVRDNTATVSGDDSQGDPVSDAAGHSQPLAQVASLEILKDGTLDGEIPLPLQGGGGPSPGTEVEYSFLVTNTGNVTLTDVLVTDPLVSPIVCPDGNPMPGLAPGQSQVCQGLYLLTQADVDLGQRVNVATATGESPSGTPVADEGEHTLPLEQQASISLEKDGSLDDGGDGVAHAGDLIHYTFEVTNTGTVTLTGVTVTDPLVSPISCPATVLAPGASMTCTGSYELTQADIDAGVRDNTATATGTAPGGAAVTDSDDHSEPIPAPPQLSVCLPTVDFDTDGGGAALAAGTIVDNEYVAIGMHVSTLDPIDHPAMIFDTANPTGGDPDLGTPNGDFGGPGIGSGGGLGEAGANALALGKVLILSEDGDSSAPNDYGGGGTLIFEFDVPVFVGAVGILDVESDDTAGTVEAFDAGGTSIAVAPILGLGNNSAQTVVLGAENVRRLEITLDGSGAVSTLLSCVEPSAIDLQKDGGLDFGANGFADAGDVIDYTFTVANTGDLPLTDVRVTDPLVPSISCPSGAPATPDLIPTLAAGVSETCTGSYVITQADVDAGVRDNTAAAGGQDLLGLTVSDADGHSEPIPQPPAIVCLPPVDFDAGGGGAPLPAGTVVDNEYVALGMHVRSNDPVAHPAMIFDTASPTGNDFDLGTPNQDFGGPGIGSGGNAGQPGENAVALGNVLIVSEDADSTDPDDDFGGGTLIFDFDFPVYLDEVGILDIDVGHGGTVEAFDAAGVSVGSAPILDPGNNSVQTVQLGAAGVRRLVVTLVSGGALTEIISCSGPKIELIKDGSLDVGSDGIANPGDLIQYAFEVANTGGVTLSNVTVTDPIVSPISCPQTSLEPDEWMTCTGSYAITQADVDAGVRDNTATATGEDPDGQPVTDDGHHSEPLAQTQAIEILKEGALDLGADGISGPGDPIDYTFAVTNTGTVTLTDVRVTDLLVPSIGCPSGHPLASLAPGASETCTGTYAITQADIDAGVRDNTATASGEDPQGNPVSDKDGHSEPIPDPPSIALVKDGALDVGGDGVASPGDLIDYTFEVTNTGTLVTLSNVIVTDPLVPSISCPSGQPIPTLAPGASETCTGSYAITQADVDAGVRDNTATVTGDDPLGNTVSDSDDHSEPIQVSVCLPAVDFDTGGGGAPLPAGTVVDNEYVAIGMHVSTDDPLNHPAMIFDSADPTPGDKDLGTPNQDFGGPGSGSGGGLGQAGANQLALGKVLIVSADGDPSVPDDNDDGGTLIFQFDFPVYVDEVGFLDVDAGETGGTVEAFDAGGSSIAVAPIDDPGNNSVQTVLLGAEGVRRLEVTLVDSGAVSGIVSCAPTAPSVILTLPSGSTVLVPGEGFEVSWVLDNAAGVRVYHDGVAQLDHYGLPPVSLTAPVEEGTYELRLEALDASGVELGAGDAIDYDVVKPPPSIEISSPVQGQPVISGTSFTLTYTVTWADGARVSYLGSTWDVMGAGEHSETLTAPSTDNVYTLAVTALDADGNSLGVTEYVEIVVFTPPPSNVSCVIGLVDVWNTGYVLNDIAVKNVSGQTITSWSVELRFAEPAAIVNSWNAQLTLSGGGTVVDAVNLSYNGTLAPGQTTTFGFQGTHDGSFFVPICTGN